ncbi:HAD family phosphatase [Sabulilitoribacter arenilitoris]|uniref:HAD family phosphatase n=1 Tax=Wocania arenilitoris TaxID=2044858 RepID=A0AAE3EQ32_9FLAO|nr:HAD family phosphatase [Wocania arenilitoris]MCF7567990.1 HAD family phosphatase [Wocania arenilitoris]
MGKIKNIVFDLGGVIMNLNVPKTIEEFERLGITNIINRTGHHYTDSVFYDFEIGKVSEFEFIEKLRKMSSLQPSSEEIQNAWNAMILNMPQERIECLINLKEKYNIYLLSNTNSIHQKKFLNEVNKENNFSFNNLFIKAYYSHELGIRKPDEKVFRFVLKDSNLNAEETLFIDDSIDNIRVAEKAGIKGCYFINGNLERNLEKYSICINH